MKKSDLVKENIGRRYLWIAEVSYNGSRYSNTFLEDGAILELVAVKGAIGHFKLIEGKGIAATSSGFGVEAKDGECAFTSEWESTLRHLLDVPDAICNHQEIRKVVEDKQKDRLGNIDS
jgi:hypothetical protein